MSLALSFSFFKCLLVTSVYTLHKIQTVRYSNNPPTDSIYFHYLFFLASLWQTERQNLLLHWDVYVENQRKIMKCNLIEFSFIPLLIVIGVLRVPLCLSSRFLFSAEKSWFNSAASQFSSCSSSNAHILWSLFIRPTIIFIHNFLYIFIERASIRYQ